MFIDRSNQGDVILVDASNLGEKIKDGKNQKTVLAKEEEDQIVEVFNAKRSEDDFSVAVSYEEIAAKNYSLSAGQFFEVKIEYVDITPKEFSEKMSEFSENLSDLFDQSIKLETQVKDTLKRLHLND